MLHQMNYSLSQPHERPDLRLVVTKSGEVLPTRFARTRRIIGTSAITAAMTVAAATIIVPIAVAAKDGPAVPGCRVEVIDGDTGLEVARRGRTDNEDFFTLNTHVPDWQELQPGDTLITEECGDLGTDHKVEPIKK